MGWEVAGRTSWQIGLGSLGHREASWSVLRQSDFLGDFHLFVCSHVMPPGHSAEKSGGLTKFSPRPKAHPGKGRGERERELTLSLPSPVRAANLAPPYWQLTIPGLSVKRDFVFMGINNIISCPLCCRRHMYVVAYSCRADLLRFWLSFKSLAVDAQKTFILVLEVGRRKTGHWGRELLQRKILISSPSLWPNSLLVWFPHKVLSYFWPRVLILRISSFQQSGCWHSRKMIPQNLLELGMRAGWVMVKKKATLRVSLGDRGRKSAVELCGIWAFKGNGWTWDH